ncbi:hypothetical protein EU546_07100 [Candidatus Thorarchaeota archaeon]|nr:MAG: hypothetical protein EU546_07100 [Candidatus Thorarchaeota archaeon]
MSSKKLIPSRIEPSGPFLSIRLFSLDGMTYSADKLAKLLKGIKYAPKNSKDATEGFAEAVASGRAVVCEFVAGFRVSVYKFKDGERKRSYYVSEDRATVIIKLSRKTVEVRGSQRIARRFRRVLQDETGAIMEHLSFDSDSARDLYDSLAIPDASKKPQIDYILITGIDDPRLAIEQAEFKGTDIHSDKNIPTWTRSYKGHISRFGGMLHYSSGSKLKTNINTEVGSLSIYASGEGILDKDIRWIVRRIEDKAR